MNKTILLLAAVLLLVGCGQPGVQEVPTEVVAQPEEVRLPEPVFQYQGDLADVTGGQATGMVLVGLNEGSYDLVATFEGLPEPQDSDFYEGWVVRQGEDLSVLSTGRATKMGSLYQNIYESDQDLTDHDFYVLTIEPDDGDPAPAGHVLEGKILPIANQ